MTSISTDLFQSGIPYIEKILRTLAVYLFLTLSLRVAGKRTLGSFNAFDLVVLLLLSNTVQNAIIGNDNSLIGGLVGAAVLLIINYMVVRYLYSHRHVDHAIEGGPTVLIRHGQIMEDALKRQLITHAELHAAVRRQGLKMSDVCTGYLETSGALSFELKTPTEQDRHFADVVDRLQRIEVKLNQLGAD